MEEVTYKNREEMVYQVLKKEILDLELKPGQLIKETEICERFSVSRTPVRDALRLLQEQGFAVQAALVHFAGMADDAVETAQNAAKALDITLHVIEAADTAADELLKFQLLMQTADKLDCRFISTGHYARVEQDADVCRLCAPEHAECDQTALLEVLPQEILARLILPLGEFDKESVQEIAQDIGCAE